MNVGAVGRRRSPKLSDPKHRRWAGHADVNSNNLDSSYRLPFELCVVRVSKQMNVFFIQKSFERLLSADAVKVITSFCGIGVSMKKGYNKNKDRKKYKVS